MSRRVRNVKDPGRILILGAGPTGLGAAWRCQELEVPDWKVLEAQPVPGGLARSVVDSHGFTWDLGGHVQFSHYPYYDRVLDEALGAQGWLWHERRAFVHLEDHEVPYPLQHNLHRLPPSIRSLAISGLLAALERPAEAPAPLDFREWLRGTFGEPLCRIFFWPYNRKVWSHPLEDMSVSWVRERVALPDRDELERQLVCSEDFVSWGPNRKFRFPREGGTGAIWRAVCALLPPERFHFGVRVVELDLSRRLVRTQTGEIFRYDTLLTTMALSSTLSLAHGASSLLQEAARALRANAVHFVGLGFRGGFPERFRGWGWVYFPEPQVPPYRVTVFSNYSPAHVPDPGCWSLLCEIASVPGVLPDLRQLAHRTLEALRQEGFIPTEAVLVSVWTHSEPYGYPIPTLGRDRALEILLPGLARHRVFSRGRFGAWRYEVSNQDHSFMQGVECVDHLCGIGEEKTLFVDAPVPTSSESRR